MVDLHKSPEKVSLKSITQKNKKCPEGKELNTKTNRCNKIKKTQKNKKCPEGKELNPKTNRCNKIKKTHKNKK